MQFDVQEKMARTQFPLSNGTNLQWERHHFYFQPASAPSDSDGQAMTQRIYVQDIFLLEQNETKPFRTSMAIVGGWSLFITMF